MYTRIEEEICKLVKGTRKNTSQTVGTENLKITNY
jgi:hypothetical protein